MRKLLLSVSILFLYFHGDAQSSFHFHIADSLRREELPGVAVTIPNTSKGIISDIHGNGTISGISDGEQKIQVSLMGYTTKLLNFRFPLSDSLKIREIFLKQANHEMEELIVSSTRTNSRIEDLATKIEVLGQEDLDEESTLVPGSVSSILGDLSIITIQKTSPINGNEAIRMQGLDARYTQIMRDGIPLYGGFSGSLGVLSIPPLDLKQVEIIKGSASTLYGGGAISGLINFISKTPGDSLLTTVSLNTTNIKESNFNLFSSEKKKKVGFTLFMGLNSKKACDINKDGFAEVPEDQNITFHPRLFFELSKKSKLIVGLNSNFDARKSGDMEAINFLPDTIHPFLEKEKTKRNTLEGIFESSVNTTHTISFKAAYSKFNRNSEYSGFKFEGVQNAIYAELSDVIKLNKHTLVAGLNLLNESFRKHSGDSVSFSNYDHHTPGIFVQDDWQIRDRLLFQLGLRYDNTLHYGNALLPRIALFYKYSDKLSMRLAGGTGYKNPNLFDFSEPNTSLSDNMLGIKPEKSLGSNFDLNFHTWLFDKLSIQLDQAIYYTTIKNVLQLELTPVGYLHLVNANYTLNSYGTDTYLRFRYQEGEFYLGYNHTEAYKANSIQKVNLAFNPKDKLSGTLAYEIEGKWRMGLETSYTGNQYVYDNRKVHNLWFMAAMIERKFDRGSIVLNCENLLDQRQSNYETLVSGTLSQPVFNPIWGPLEGRVVNLSVKISI